MTATLIVSTGTAYAVQAPQDRVVSADPVNSTPHVLDGRVHAVAEVGNTIVLGGAFTQARNPAAGSPVLARTNLLAFDKTTGEISTTFVPAINGIVKSLAAAADGTSVYVAGQFSQIDGTPAYKIARLDVTSGQRVAGFNPGLTDAIVYDVKLNGNRLFIGGAFSKANYTARTALAELDPNTGALRPALNVPISGTVWGGKTQVFKLDVTPDGSRMAIIGNFREVGGQLRTQAAMLDLTTNPVSVTSWASPAFDVRCGSSGSTLFDVRDVDFSPDGSYFIIGATGGHTYPGAICDGVSRWETNRTGSGQQPTWLALTGGDSVYSVAATGTAVYAGGHFRWFNNPIYIQSYKGPGAVDRVGIAALDPVTGIPLKWNPGRSRGQAVWDLLATTTGLWVGNDTDLIGSEYHARIAFFPLAGGTPVPQPATLQLPVDVQLMSPASAPDGLVRRQDFAGTSAGPAELLADAGNGWSAVRGAFMAEGFLYAVRTDKTLVKRTVSGTTYGAPQNVNLNGLTAFADELPATTSMFYAEGRLYYTLSGQNALYMRFLTVESDIVGATRYTVTGGITGVDWSAVRGAFLVQGELYVAESATGNLTRVTWTDRAPVPGTAVAVSGPGIDGIDWRSNGLFVTIAMVDPVPSDISFVGVAANTQQATTTTRSVIVPAATVAGDTMVMTWSANGLDTQVQAPAGWQLHGTAATAGSTTGVWTRTATAGDAGSSVAVSSSTLVKADLVLAVYRDAQVSSVVLAAETTTTTQHVSPQAQVTAPGSWAVSYWADKSGATTAWTGPANTTARHTYAGSGAGHVSELMSDSGGPVSVGSTGGLVGTADSAQKNATMVTIVLAPAA